MQCQEIQGKHRCKAVLTTRVPVSYKDSLVGDILGAYEQAFKFDLIRDDGEESATELEPLIEDMVDVNLSKETKS